MDSNISITYQYNSGFTIDYLNTFVVIDDMVARVRLPKDKNIVFIVTHAEEDHYNPDIFTLPGAERAHFLLSEDVEPIETDGKLLKLASSQEETARKKIVYDPNRTLRLGPDTAFSFGGLTGRTYRSTDLGFAIRFQIGNIQFFHAGDLNAWMWPQDSKKEQRQAEEDYLRILKEVAEEPVDVGFGVLEPVLKENAFVGAAHYLEILKPQIFIPMHFRMDPPITRRFREKYGKNTQTIIQAIQRPGDRILIQG